MSAKQLQRAKFCLTTYGVDGMGFIGPVDCFKSIILSLFSIFFSEFPTIAKNYKYTKNLR